MNVAEGKGACVDIHKVPQVPGVKLKSLERRAVEKAEALEGDFGQRYDRGSCVDFALRRIKYQRRAAS